MSTRLGIISDPHATPGPVNEALAIFDDQGVDAVLCPGDVAGYGEETAATVALLEQYGCATVLGNHDRWYLEDATAQSDARVLNYFRDLPRFREWEFDGCRLFMVHASPPDSDMLGIRLLDENGDIIVAEKSYWHEQLAGFDYDVLLVGHTHQIFAEQLGHPLVINPGSSKFNHSCVILTLPSLQLEIFGLSGRVPVRSWNWGMLSHETLQV